MPKYKTRSDIPYIKFMEFSEAISKHSTDTVFIADKVIEYFYPEAKDNEALYVEEFAIALNTKGGRFIPYFLSLSKLNKADNFIDSEVFASDKDYQSLLQLIVKPLNWFGLVNIHNISLNDGERIMKSFLRELPKLNSPFNIFATRQLGLQFKR